MTRIKDETIENKERLKILESQLEQVDVEVNTNELAEKINRHYHLLIGKDISIQDLDYEQQKLLVDWYFGMSKDTGVYLMQDKQNGVVFNVVGAFHSSYLGIIQKEWNTVLILGFREDIQQPFVRKDPDVQVDFKRLLESLAVQSKTEET